MSGTVHLRRNLKMVWLLYSITYQNYQHTTDSIRCLDNQELTLMMPLRPQVKFLLVSCGFVGFLCVILSLTARIQHRDGKRCMGREYEREMRENPAGRMTERCRSNKAKAMAFFQRWTLIIWQATIEPEIREITSIVMPSPTDTNRSAEDRIRRIEEHNLAAHHAPLFKTHNGLWPSAMPVNHVECSKLDVQRLYRFST